MHVRYSYVKGEIPYAYLAKNPEDLDLTVYPQNVMSLICGYAPTDDVSDIYPNAVAAIEGKDSKNMWLDPRDAEIISDGNQVVRYFGGVRECDFHYTPETWDYHIRDNVHDTRWTLMNANPEESHFLHVYVMHPGKNGQGSAGSQRWVRVDINCSYTVQFREHSLSRDHESGVV